MAEQTIKKTREQIEEKRSQLESALLDFPDPWDMVEEIAESSIDLIHLRQQPHLRELSEGEAPHSEMEKEIWREALTDWHKKHRELKDRFNKAVTQLEKYKRAKQELTKFGKK